MNFQELKNWQQKISKECLTDSTKPDFLFQVSAPAVAVILQESTFLVAWQKLPTFRKSEKKNLLILVHGAQSCTTFKIHTWPLNTLYMLENR